jgi:hypothetical protein
MLVSKHNTQSISPCVNSGPTRATLHVLQNCLLLRCNAK